MEKRIRKRKSCGQLRDRKRIACSKTCNCIRKDAGYGEMGMESGGGERERERRGGGGCLWPDSCCCSTAGEELEPRILRRRRSALCRPQKMQKTADNDTVAGARTHAF